MSAAPERRADTAASSDPADDPRVFQAVQEYLAAMEGGARPNRLAFLARHPEIAGAVAECLDALEFVQSGVARLERPVAGPAESSSGAPAFDTAQPLGDFRIRREIGRGGMGIVYEAEQISLGRRVALKVLPFAWTLDPRQLRRFQNEARAVAHLHHTNIVPIYSVGCERSVHFYAMQYIDGRSLAAVIQEMRQMGGHGGLPRPTSLWLQGEGAATPGPTWAVLTTERTSRGSEYFRAVARLGAQAAEALEHAHDQGVVHRDVKPGNLLVDAHGHLWVSDFGLAQFQGDGAMTVTGDLVGTLRYMSPEQALGKRGLVDHRTDVYALGATLYELLTVTPVFPGRDREELLRQIAFEEPQPPRRLNAAIPPDLETILLKALAKRVEDRYATAREMAEDLRRFLEHRPVLAKRPTLLERTAKWLRRHPAVVAGAVVLLLLAAIGFGVSTALIAREQWKTKSAYEAEARQRARAEKSFRQARQFVDFITELSTGHLADKPELKELRRSLLEASRDYYRDFIDECQDDPSLRAQLLAGQLNVARILDAMGAPEDAMAALDRAAGSDPHKAPGRGRPASSLSGREFHLLSQPAVQKDLKLSDEQVNNLEDLGRRRRDAWGKLYELRPEVWRISFEELVGQEQALAELLQPEQARRLRQIALQQAGADAFAAPEVILALHLSPEQLQRLRGVREEMHRAMDAVHRTGPRSENWKKAEECWKAGRDQALQVLTEEQRASWKELLGEPFGNGSGRPPSRDGFGPRHGSPRETKPS
jgi:serine/threonine protein kinase